MEPQNQRIIFLWISRFRMKFGNRFANGDGCWSIYSLQFVICYTVKKRIGGHQRLPKICEAIMLVFIWVCKYRNFKDHAPNLNSKSHSALAYEVQRLSFLWINARKRKGQNLRWFEWQCDPVMASFFSLF